MGTIEQNGDDFPPDILAALLRAISPSRDAERIAQTRVSLLERIRADKSAAAAQEGLLTVRASEGTWKEFAPGVRAKVLHDDGQWQTWLARMTAEARLPAHVHADTEECLVLEGSVYFGNVEIHAGDYQAALPGSRHDGVYSRTGCLMLVRSRSPQPA